MNTHLLSMFFASTLAVWAIAQTNAPTAQVDELRRRIESGTGPAIHLTPEEDALLVKAGVLPPLAEHRPSSSATNDSPTVGRMEILLIEAPIALAAGIYADFTGKQVTVAPGMNATITVRSTGSVSRAEGAALMEKAFANKGLRIKMVDAKTVRIERQ